MPGDGPIRVIEVDGDIRFVTRGVLWNHLKHVLNYHERWEDLVDDPALLEEARCEFASDQLFEGEKLNVNDRVGPCTWRLGQWYTRFLSAVIREACATHQHHVHHREADFDCRQTVIVFRRDSILWSVAKITVRDGDSSPYVIASGLRPQLWNRGPMMTAEELERKILEYVERLEVNEQLLAIHDTEVTRQLEKSRQYESDTGTNRPA